MIDKTNEPALRVDVFGEEVLSTLSCVDVKIVLPRTHVVFDVKNVLRIENLKGTKGADKT